MPPARAAVLPALLISACLAPRPAQANDAAAEIAAGGLRLREERRVSMNRERLTISKLKAARPVPGISGDRYHVTVEYEFVAQPGPDVWTEVAFPLPEYGFDIGTGTRKIEGFVAEVDGRVIRVERQVRAYVEGRDVTRELSELGLDIERLGGFRDDARSPTYAVTGLQPKQREALLALGALLPPAMGEPFALAPAWRVVVTYFWRQRFPAGQVVRVRHAYDAVPGYAYESSASGIGQGSLGPPGCFDTPLVKALEGAQRRLGSAPGDKPLIFLHWVGYVLTTANTWKTPIADFELNLDFPDDEFVSLCWDGPLERVSKNRFRARVKDFVPTRELTVYFLNVGAP